jgi:hypothetical protein
MLFLLNLPNFPMVEHIIILSKHQLNSPTPCAHQITQDTELQVADLQHLSVEEGRITSQ